MRFLPVFVVVSTFLPAVFSIPVALERASDLSVSRRDSGVEVFEREFGLNHRTRDLAYFESIYQRSRKNAKAAAKGKTSPNQSGRPKNAIVTFGDAARAHLDELGLHGKDRKRAKKYHKQVVKEDMKNHGAHSARIFHLAHTGGSDPNEKNHITAGYYKAPKNGVPGEQIRSPWSLEYESKNPGKPSKGLFHIYPTKEPKVPPAWAAASAASDARKAAEAERERLAVAAAEKARHERVEAERKAGQTLSPEEKRAQREAAKAAKAAKKKGAP